MKVDITFRNMFATDALRNHVQEKLEKVTERLRACAPRNQKDVTGGAGRRD